MPFLSQFRSGDLRAYLEEQIARQDITAAGRAGRAKCGSGGVSHAAEPGESCEPGAPHGAGLTADQILARTGRFLSGEIRLGPPARCRINKIGTDKKRTVYIFQEEDQLVLKTLNYCLSREDLGLLPCCLAFRPGFCVHGAFRGIIRQARAEYSCIHLDIRNYFNSIPADLLIRVLEKRLSAWPDLLSALTGLLQDPIVLDGGAEESDPAKGAMAGMPLAPLLANLYLSDFDAEAQGWVPVYGRYSDDLILFCLPEDVPAVLERARAALEARGLVLNEGKTRVVGPGGRWEFLGLSYRQGEVSLSEATIRKMKGKISRSARKLYRWKVSRNASTERAVRALVRKFQYKFFGSGKDDDELTWSRWYFPLINRTDGLREIDRYFQQWARYLADGRHSRMNYRKVPYGLLRECGYVPLLSVYRKRERDPSLRRRAAEGNLPPQATA